MLTLQCTKDDSASMLYKCVCVTVHLQGCEVRGEPGTGASHRQHRTGGLAHLTSCRWLLVLVWRA